MWTLPYVIALLLHAFQSLGWFRSKIFRSCTLRILNLSPMWLRSGVSWLLGPDGIGLVLHLHRLLTTTLITTGCLTKAPGLWMMRRNMRRETFIIMKMFFIIAER